MFWTSFFPIDTNRAPSSRVTSPGDSSSLVSLMEEILSSGTTLRIKVTGRSMAPFLSGGEVVSLAPVSKSLLHRGDLVLFKNNLNQPVLHRIIQKRVNTTSGTFYLTKGDAAMVFDTLVPGDHILGKVVAVEHPAGKKGNAKILIQMTTPSRRILNNFNLIGSLWRTMAGRIKSKMGRCVVTAGWKNDH